MKNKNYKLYKVPQIRDLKELINLRAETRTYVPAFVYSEEDVEMTITYGQLKKDIEALGTKLFDMKLINCNIALLGENSYYWILIYFSVANGNNTVVPIDRNLSPNEITRILEDSHCSTIFYSESCKNVIENIKRDNKSHILNHISMSKIPDLLLEGNQIINSGNLDYVNYKVDKNCTAAIVYTSGTTASSKAVMLSHQNLAVDTCAACRNCFFEGDTLLLLPLYHTFGLVAGIFVIMLYGYSIYINTSLKQLSANLCKSKPQCLFLVPAFVEMLYKKLWMIIEKNGKVDSVKRKIVISRLFQNIGIDIRKKLFSKEISYLGGKLEIIISGGAFLNSKYVKGFRDFGIDVLNGYGITECSPVVAVNRNDYYRDGSVGVVLSECEVKIDNPNEKGEGEIVVKGSNVMQGYYNEVEEDPFCDGWFRTGDIGYIDDGGFLFITGRIKNLIILSNGENISPEGIESVIKELPLVDEVIVCEDRQLLSAEIYPNYEYAEKNGIKDIYEALKADIFELNKKMPKYRQVNCIKLRNIAFDKTSTQKIKRK